MDALYNMDNLNDTIVGVPNVQHITIVLGDIKMVDKVQRKSAELLFFWVACCFAMQQIRHA